MYVVMAVEKYFEKHVECWYVSKLWYQVIWAEILFYASVCFWLKRCTAGFRHGKYFF